MPKSSAYGSADYEPEVETGVAKGRRRWRAPSRDDVEVVSKPLGDRVDASKVAGLTTCKQTSLLLIAIDAH